jgi:hypothetical protein
MKFLACKDFNFEAKDSTDIGNCLIHIQSKLDIILYEASMLRHVFDNFLDGL